MQTEGLQNILCPINNTNRVFRFDLMVAQQSQQFNTSQNPKNPIVATSSWLCVEMGSSVDGSHILALSRTNGKGVAHGIHDNVAAQSLGGFDEPISRLLVRV